MTLPPDNSPRFAAALSTLGDTRAAVREAGGTAMVGLGTRPDLAFVFASMHHQENFASLAEILHRDLGTDCLLGCSGEAIVCNDREIENSPAVAVWLAHLPGVTLRPMHLDFELTPEGGTFVGWPDELADAWPSGANLLLLAEPYSFATDLLLDRLDGEHPGTQIIGGMASGGRGPRENQLLLGGREFDSGAVAVLIGGPIKLASVVSQGCRPIGRPFVVTKAQSNVMLELGGRPALEQLQDLFGSLTADEQQLARGGLHVGQVINEYQDRFGRGDFLVRNVQGADPKSGAIAIGDRVRVGQTVQFHVRDAATADEDLNIMLAARRDAPSRPLAALLFTCNGRGTRLFDRPHHDAAALARSWSGLPVAGFFAQGEIGPVGGKNFLHGFTASIALFEAAE